MSDVLACAVQLVKLKEVQQQNMLIVVNKLVQEKQQLKNKIDQLELEISDNSDKSKNFSRNFYQELETKVFDDGDMRYLRSTLDRFRVEREELLKKRQQLTDDLVNLESELEKKAMELRNVVVKQEKYNYLIEGNLGLG